MAANVIDLAVDKLNAAGGLEWTDAPTGDGEFGAVARRSDRGSIALVESRAFLAECIRESMRAAFASFEICNYPDVGALGADGGKKSPKLVLLSAADGGQVANALQILAQSLPNVPSIVLAGKNDADLARVAVRNGAKGFIPLTTGFQIAVEAVRFVLCGGTYVPADCLFGAGGSAAPTNALGDSLTSREFAVVKAIQQGKPNKIIAYELNMCESTVKVHLRNIMKKLGARNRTDVAIKAQGRPSTDNKAAAGLTVAA